ncbi:hypothetical protein HNO92_002588 [Chromobacterium alkanivorans]|uniref:hypothetical protein n=1 Tax=Chromobacterium TaxID=535 RepID=UPI000310A856|nr:MULTISPECIES: hypothetical protein [Chromobacterium]MBN3003892.1 VacJ [Chromobacterium alkanivorans]MCS3805417.1 hypothetical protein [Chromobacterium alkanivorans]MCS3819756.1 hypothetical protein [Chromobacterium alkanivorans]MCS3874269.1 hypothetical protein [Chromobacterium alkanivorans]
MYEVNRSIALIRPLAPFHAWLQALPGGLDEEISLAHLGQDCNALLIPAAEDYADAQAFVHERYQQLFQAELADWCDDDSLWPEELSLELFQQWFAVEIHSIVTDLVDEALEREAFVPLELGE